MATAAVMGIPWRSDVASFPEAHRAAFAEAPPPTFEGFACNAEFVENLGYYPDVPVVLGPGGGRLALSKNSADPKLDPEWRKDHCTIAGLAKKWILEKNTGSATFDPMSYVLGTGPYGLRQGLNESISDTWMDPHALSGLPSPRLQATIEHLVCAMDNPNWGVLVPLRYVPLDSSNVVHWVVTTYHPAMANEMATPLAAPSMVTAEGHIEKQQLTYYGIAARIALGFWKTEIGGKHWNESLIQVASGITAAEEYSAAMGLVAAPDKYLDTIRRTSKDFKLTIDEVQDQKAYTFALFQNANHAYFSVYMQKLRHQAVLQHAEGGEFVFLTTREAVIALIKGNRDAVRYDVAGAEGPQQLDQLELSRVKIHGVWVYSMPSFHMPGGSYVHPFSLPWEIGEYIDYMDETAPGRAFDVSTLNRLIFDRNNNWVAVPFNDAIKNLACWNENGNLLRPKISKFDNPPPHWWKGPKYTQTVTLSVGGNWTAEAPRKVTADEEDDVRRKSYANFPFVEPVLSDPSKATIWAGFPLSLPAAEAMYQKVAEKTAWYTEAEESSGTTAEVDERKAELNKCHFPFQILAVQLHQRGFGHMGMYMKPGEVAIRVRKQNEGFAILADSSETRTHQLIVQYTAGVAIIKAKNAVAGYNLVVTQVDSGGGTTPIKPGADYDPTIPDGSGVVGDMMYLVLPPATHYRVQNLPRNFNARGIVEGELSQLYCESNDPFANCYPGFRYNDALFGWTAKKCGQRGARWWTDQYRKYDLPINVFARRACYRKFCPQSGQYSIYQPGKGFWKMEGTYDNVADTRGGGTFDPHPERGHNYSVDQ